MNGTTPLPNPMPVDLTLDWASPGAVGGITPVPLVTHLHGGDVLTPQDGGPDAWGTPFAIADTLQIIQPKGAGFQQGRLYTAPYTYDNAQEAGTLWYHDHALGITRTNVYMGLAGYYLLRDANEDNLRDTNVLPKYPYEVPIVIQDREFTNAGQLFYPAGVNPVNSHLPEFFGRVILANGQAWPKLNVEPRKYRLRMLNGSDSRFYDLRFEAFAPRANVVPGKGRPLPILVVGNELGLLDNATLASLDSPIGGVRPVPSTPNVLALGTGERYDVVVDFKGLVPGSRVVMTNTARSPYPDAAKPEAGLTDRIMAFDVAGMEPPLDVTVGVNTDLRTINPDLGPNPIQPGQVAPLQYPVRKILLFEGTDVFGRLQTMLGPVDVDPVTTLQGTLTYKDPITETPTVGTTEVWEFYNSTVDAHPMHMHLVDFRVIDRQTFTGVLTPKVNSDGSNGAILDPANIRKTGTAIAPGAWEAGKKDTVKLFPGEVTRILVSFNKAGEYVYHCHILSHEDHEMMRPYEVK